MADMDKVLELPAKSTLVRRRWLLANGAQEVELIDETEASWEANLAVGS